jgi:hypothetical protein
VEDAGRFTSVLIKFSYYEVAAPESKPAEKEKQHDFMNFPTWIAVISGILGFALAHRCLRSRSFKFRMLAFVALGVLAIPTILFAVYYLHVLPERAWFYDLRAWSGSELLAVFLGGAGGALASILPRFLLVIPLFLAISTTAVPYLKMIFSPLDTGELHEKWDGDACLQSTASTCGPASTASILRFLGYPATEREIATAAHSSSSGTEAWYLRSRGLSAKFEFGSTFNSSVSLPAVVGVRVSGYGHFIAVLKIEDGRVTFVDPLSGLQEMDLSAFMKTYTFTRFHLAISKQRS